MQPADSTRRETLLDGSVDPWTAEHALPANAAAASSGGLLIVGQVAQAILNLAVLAFLARLLVPEDFGLVSMVTAITALLEIVRSFGVSETLLRSARVTHEIASAMFWTSIAIGATTALIAICSGPAIARFYSHQELSGIATALGFGLMVTSLGVQHDVLLRRQMRFTERVLLDVTASAVGSASAIVMALSGWGYWALVALLVVTASCNTVGLWVLVRWRPALPASSHDTRGLLRFGGRLTMANLMQYVIENFDKVLIGRQFGAGQLGLYTRVYQLMTAPISLIAMPLGRVAIPVLARWHDHPVNFREYYCRTVNLIAYLTTPLIVIGAVLSEEIVTLLLGDQWQGAGMILAVLAIGTIGQPIGSANGWVMIASGHSGRILLLAIIRAAVFVLGFLIGMNWGPLGVAVAYSVCSHGVRIPATAVALRGTHVSMQDLFRSCWRPMALSLALVIPAVLAREMTEDLSSLARIGVTVAAAALSAAATVMLSEHVRRELVAARQFLALRGHRPPPPVTP